MPTLPSNHNPKSEVKGHEKYRGTTTERGYGHQWQKARIVFLHKHPICKLCADKGRVCKAEAVDHIIPHKGDRQLFWDRENWMALCIGCHNRKTAKEDGGFGNPRGVGNKQI